MKIMGSEWRDRLEHWIRTLKEDFHTPLGEIAWEMFPTAERLSAQQAAQGPFVPVSPGFAWGHTWEYGWFKSSIVLPDAAEGERIVLNLSPGGESTLFVNGSAFGTYRADWVDQPHHFLVDNTLTRRARAGERFELLMETYAGHYFPDVGFNATGPVLPGSFTDPLPEGARRVLGPCTYDVWNEDAYQLFLDVDTLTRLLETLDETSLRAAKIAQALEQFTLDVDFEQPRAQRIAAYRAARAALRPVLAAKNGATMPTFYAVGNAHLDLAWLWPMAETFRKTARTFAAQLRLMDEYPDYKFIQSQPAAYEMCREYDPALYARILQAIRRGQWIADGAMWVEPDTNMAGGEALIRQLVHGKRYFREALGVDSRILWLPDTFGYSAALPQILRGCGVDFLVTQKIFWTYNDGEHFPYHYFNWRGMDGSEVVSFLPTSYAYRVEPVETNRTWRERTQLRDLDAFLMPFGYGDGGGGPTRDHIEYARRQEDLEGGARIRLAGPAEFFAQMQAQGGPVNTWVGELYFSAHRGTYTSQARIKRNNRKSELALREMEFWSSVALTKGASYEYEAADALWKQLLLHQFHDILPGSGIARVYTEANEALAALQKKADTLKETAHAFLTDAREKSAVTVWNSLSFCRTALIELPTCFARGARTREGAPVPVQAADGTVRALVTLPACGAVSLVPDSEAAAADRPTVTVRESAESFLLENGLVRLRVDRNGEVQSFVLQSSGREFAAGAMNRFRFYRDVPRKFDAWDIDSNYLAQELPALEHARVEKIAEGLEGVLRLTGTVGHSRVTQYIRLAAQSRRVVFETEIDWKELHRLLKVSFPVRVYAENGINEIQFGYVERPTHRSRPCDRERFEVCNHRYSALCDGTHGAAVLNDCKYGISMRDNALELTLLRAPAGPEMRADNAVHPFAYAFTAWEGDFAHSDVVRQGCALNVRPDVTPGALDTFCAVEIERENILLDTMKPAEDGSGDIILRLYECKKAAVQTALRCRLDVRRAYLCDMLENAAEELPLRDGVLQLSFRAFEIKTLRLTR